MYVAPEQRRRGIARALVDAALAVLGRAGIEQVRLTVTSPSTAARSLYHACGFRAVGVLPRALKDGARYLDEELLLVDLDTD
jgi:ribosomal protein S18 acetylase RimI-like enzyme